MELRQLLCGDAAQLATEIDCEVARILEHIGATIDSTLKELSWLETQTPDRVSIYGPALSRTLLEVGATALIGRLDPNRLLVIKRTQEHQDYVTTKPWKSSIRWQGDVMPAEKVGNLWTDNLAYKDMTRALLGDYYGALYWLVAMKRVADLAVPKYGAWVAGLRSLTPEQFVVSRREKIGRMYASTSKGIHAEFVVPPGSVYDRATIATQVNNIYQMLAELGLLVNLLPHVPYRMSVTHAVAAIDHLETVEILK